MMRMHSSTLIFLALVAAVRGGNDYYTDDRTQQKGGNYNDDWVASNQHIDDDMFHWSDNTGFDGVSIMPLSCIS